MAKKSIISDEDAAGLVRHVLDEVTRLNEFIEINKLHADRDVKAEVRSARESKMKICLELSRTILPRVLTAQHFKENIPAFDKNLSQSEKMDFILEKIMQENIDIEGGEKLINILKARAEAKFLEEHKGEVDAELLRLAAEHQNIKVPELLQQIKSKVARERAAKASDAQISKEEDAPDYATKHNCDDDKLCNEAKKEVSE